MAENHTTTTGTFESVRDELKPAPQALSRRSHLVAWLFLLPALLLQLSRGWYPLIVAFVLSFTDGRVRGPSVSPVSKATCVWRAIRLPYKPFG
jgi:multiple sugar transport system permease protein